MAAPSSSACRSCCRSRSSANIVTLPSPAACAISISSTSRLTGLCPREHHMSEQRAVIVICDSLRRDLISPDDAPFLTELSERAAFFAAHRSVFPSTTRASAATIATGCLPARHGLLGNTMALDEGDGLVCRTAGAPDFRDRMRRATGRTLRVPTLAERLRWHGETSISAANVSPGAAYFQDPDGHGWVHHAAGRVGPGCRPIDDPASAGLQKGIAGDRAMTERFCAELLEGRAPSLA